MPDTPDRRCPLCAGDLAGLLEVVRRAQALVAPGGPAKCVLTRAELQMLVGGIEHISRINTLLSQACMAALLETHLDELIVPAHRLQAIEESAIDIAVLPLDDGGVQIRLADPAAPDLRLMTSRTTA